MHVRCVCVGWRTLRALRAHCMLRCVPAQAEASRVGFPLLVKAVMGGGGKGMKLARGEAEFMVSASAGESGGAHARHTRQAHTPGTHASTYSSH